MSLEKKLTEVVESANKLTQTVSEKQQVIDHRMTQMAERVDSHIADIDSHLTRICITQNPSLYKDPETGFPYGFRVNEQVTAEKFITISDKKSERTAEQLAVLSEIENDLGVDLRKDKYYKQPFNIYRLSWTAVTPGVTWLGYPRAIHRNGSSSTQTRRTTGALVKLISGSISGSWGNGSVTGKWTFNTSTSSPSNSFGHYYHPHPLRRSDTGELLVAFPATCTGSISSLEGWFPLVELQE